MTEPPNSFVRRLAFITGIALVVRVLIIVVVDPNVPELGDASAYHLLANHLADGRGYIRPFDLTRLHLVVPTAEYPPLHPFVLSLFARLGLRSVEAQRLGLGVIGSATVATIGIVGRQIAGKRVGLIAAGLAAISPMMFLPEATLMSETIFVFLVTLALYLTGRLHANPTPTNVALLGLVLGLAVLTRAEALVLAPLLVIPTVLRNRSAGWGRRIGIGALGLGVAFVVVVPWTIRNQSTFDSFVPVSNNLGTALAGANCPLTYGGPYLGSWRSIFDADPAAKSGGPADHCFRGFNGSQPRFNEATAAGAARRQGLDFAFDHLREAPKVAAARLLRTFGLYRPAQQIDLEALEGRPASWERAGTWFEWSLYPFAIAGMVLMVRRRTAVWPLIAATISVVVATLVTYGNQRFRIGAEPTILIAAAVGIAALTRRSPALPTGSDRPSTIPR